MIARTIRQPAPISGPGWHWLVGGLGCQQRIDASQGIQDVESTDTGYGMIEVAGSGAIWRPCDSTYLFCLGELLQSASEINAHQVAGCVVLSLREQPTASSIVCSGMILGLVVLA